MPQQKQRQKQQYLHELLREEQEPFQLKTYIAAKKSAAAVNHHAPPQTAAKSSVQVIKKRKPNALCKQACFFSINDSPDVFRRSPITFPSPAASHGGGGGGGKVLLHIPARTAALLLEAAVRIQKQSAANKPKSQIKNVGFGLFGSILKRLKDRNRNRNRGIKSIGEQSRACSVSAINGVEQNRACSVSVSAINGEEQRIINGDNHSRLSSAVWSEKSMDLETSTSCRSEESEEAQQSFNGDFCVFENLFCNSPLSPFRFSLERCESPSPASSPVRRRNQGKEKYENEELENAQQEEDEEEKEQSSPVSVLDPPFEDSNYGHEEEDDNEEHDSDRECSYAVVQRAQQQLLRKLHRFEKLAELDPIELEKIMLEEEDTIIDGDEKEEPNSRGNNEGLEGFSSDDIIPFEMKRLVSDLIYEERNEANREIVWGRVCKRLDSWKETNLNTIDMMVELDFRTESGDWKSFGEQVEETAMEIEASIFAVLVDEILT